MIYQGDCLNILRTFDPNSIDMCLTSPPYWGLRDYGVEQVFGGDVDCEHEWNSCGKSSQRLRDPKAVFEECLHPSLGNICLKCGAWKGQLGLEPTPELYIEHMTAVFSEVKRALKDEGTLWLNMGDTYSGNPSWESENLGNKDGLKTMRGRERKLPLPQKCLCMIPERLAWSLIQDGWILRNKCVWFKPNGMPSSVKDRFSNKWEYLFMFSKNNRTLLWQHKETKEWTKTEPLGTKGEEGIDWEWKEDKKVSLWHGFTYYFDLDAVREPFNYPERTYNSETKHHSTYQLKENGNKTTGGLHDGREQYGNPELGKNPGDVFEIPTQPFPEAHFAVFPEKLCDKPIKAGCPEGGIVLDPFCGSGTALYVAKEMGRRYIGIEINPEYIKLAEKRLAQKTLEFQQPSP